MSSRQFQTESRDSFVPNLAVNMVGPPIGKIERFIKRALEDGDRWTPEDFQAIRQYADGLGTPTAIAKLLPPGITMREIMAQFSSYRKSREIREFKCVHGLTGRLGSCKSTFYGGVTQ
jgi:hypothetical protein